MRTKINRKAVKKIKIDKAENDFRFWQSRPYEERLETLESIRNEEAAEKLRKALPQIKQRPLDDYSTLLGGPAHEGKTAIGEPEQDQGQPENPETKPDKQGIGR